MARMKTRRCVATCMDQMRLLTRISLKEWLEWTLFIKCTILHLMMITWTIAVRFNQKLSFFLLLIICDNFTQAYERHEIPENCACMKVNLIRCGNNITRIPDAFPSEVRCLVLLMKIQFLNYIPLYRLRWFFWRIIK